MGLFAPQTPTLEEYPNARPSKAQREEWAKIRARRVAAYRAACDALAAVIVQHAGDLLEQRANVIAACVRRPLAPEIVRTLREGGPALGMALEEAFKAVDWLPLAPYLRSHNVGDAPPSEFSPLEAIVESALSPLRSQRGLPLRPPGESGKALSHTPLDSAHWPSTVRVRRCVVRMQSGLAPWRESVEVDEPHAVQSAFRKVADLAGELDALDIREGQRNEQRQGH